MVDEAPIALHSVEAERAALGAAIYKNEYADVLLEALKSSDFFLGTHRTIYQAIKAIRKAGGEMDLLPIRSLLQSKGKLEAVGGDAELIRIVEGVPSPSNVALYCSIVKENSVLRQMEAAGRKIAELATDENLETPEKLRRMQELAEIGKVSLNGHAKAIAGCKFEAGSFVPVELDYLWEPRMPRGKILLWDADGGTGKTALLAAISAGLSIGQLPNGDGECAPVRTAYFHKGEDDDDEIATLFYANGGNFDNVVFYNLPELNLDRDGLQEVDRIVGEGGFEHVVFDALFYFCLHLQREGWKDPMAVLPTLEGLKDIARRHNACFSDLRHTSKGKADKDAADLGFGSVQFRNSHRGQMVMRYHPKPQTEAEHGLVIVTDEKGSLLSPRAPAFAFRRRGNQIEYVQDFDNPFDPRDSAANRKGVREMNARWLTSLLMEGPRLLTEVKAMAKARGIAERTLYRLFADMGGFSETRGFGENCRAIWHISQPEKFDFDPFADDEEEVSR